MTVISVLKDVAADCGLAIPAQVFSSSDRTAVELDATLNEAALHIARYHEWQALNAEGAVTGDGINVAFPMPSFFDRFRDSVRPWNTTTNLPLVWVREPSKWHEIERRGIDPAFQHCIILNDRLHIKPALADAGVVQFYFQSKNIFVDQGGAYKNAATLDTDTFRLDERALKLVTEAFWRSKNGQATAAEYLQKATALLDDLVALDKGDREKSTVKAA